MRIILNGSVSTVKRLRVSLGTLVAIEATASAVVVTATVDVTATEDFTAGAAETAIAEAAIERAFQAIERVNRLMHPRAEGSDLARINSAALGVSIKVHRSVGQLLNFARRINTLTEGVFDPCTPARPGRLSDIEVSGDETEVVCHAPVALDLGGFAKGYAVDCAIEALLAGGCTAGLVNAGGDLRVFGQRTEPVFVRGTEGELTQIELIDAALAVSDATAPQRPPEHQGYYIRCRDANAKRDSAATPNPEQHAAARLPATHEPAANVAAPIAVTYAAVIANTAVVADALAKCVLLCPPATAARALQEFGAAQSPA